MIYNVENTAAIDNPVMVFDANGIKIPYPIEVDTVTGRVLRYVTTKNSQGETLFVVNPHKDGIVIIEETFPAPLLVMPCAKEALHK